MAALTRNDRIFSSVFPSASYTTPTPEATPNIGFLPSPNPSFGSFSQSVGLSVGDLLARRNLAWSTATRWLAIPDREPQDRQRVDDVHGFRNAVSFLQQDDPAALLTWFGNAVRKHYDDYVKTQLRALWQHQVSCQDAETVLIQTLSLLERIQAFYLHPVQSISRPVRSRGISSEPDDPVQDFHKRALDRVQSMIRHSLPSERVEKTLSFLLYQLLQGWMLPGGSIDPASRSTTFQLLERLQQCGLSLPAHSAFSRSMRRVVDDVVDSKEMRVDWVYKTSVVPKLRGWVEDRWWPALQQGVVCLSSEMFTMPLPSNAQHAWAIERIGKARAKNLFDYIRTWDHSMGAILDIKEWFNVCGVEAKNTVATLFRQQLSQRVLHAGATTSEILSIYVNVIYVFKILDPRGVLLEKVAQPLRSYLRDREDTVRIIAASFLADTDELGNVTETSDEICADIAKEVALSEGAELQASEKGLDWDDMEWMPDPIDAGPDFRRNKSEDIISYMITLFNQADFIKELQNILGERLLKSEGSDLEKEFLLIELFKARFGQDKLQACEVMLRDVRDSRNISDQIRGPDLKGLPSLSELRSEIPDDGILIQDLIRIFQTRIPVTQEANTEFIRRIRRVGRLGGPGGRTVVPKPLSQQELAAIQQQDQELPLQVQILSSFFWPSLRDDQFSVPTPIAHHQAVYAKRYERIKDMRKLQWLPALGYSTVELALEDRTVTVEGVHTWQASVIYAFQEGSEASMQGVPVTKTVDELAEALQMDDLLVRNALAFWVGRRVLAETEADTYTVLETLDQETTAPPRTAAAQPPPEVSAVKTQDALLRQNKDMYGMFMIGMLTNGGAMDLARITMMLKMVVPGGFAFGEDEVRWLLTDLETQGKVVGHGGTFAVKK